MAPDFESCRYVLYLVIRPEAPAWCRWWCYFDTPEEAITYLETHPGLRWVFDARIWPAHGPRFMNDMFVLQYRWWQQLFTEAEAYPQNWP